MLHQLTLLLISSALAAGCERPGNEASVVIAPATSLTPTPRERPADAAVTAAVRSALQAQPRLAASPVRISTHAGVVVLEGRVGDVPLAQHAGVLAAEVDGVIDVDNRLRPR
ncbi:MAG: BON domain-containing protein [Gammaproteobacteria bacterium]|nr:BON domain-containing protein [Gammaproteobacteria bacterium]